MNFHIVSDSSCDLGRERLQQLGVDMVSYYVALGDEVYYRAVSYTHLDVYKRQP